MTNLEDFQDFFDEEMSSVWTGAAEFGWLVDDEEIAAVPLERLMLLREEWPDQTKAITLPEYSIAGMLDWAISVCFVALGVAYTRDDRGNIGITTIPENPDDAKDVATRRAHRLMANRLAEGIEEALAELKNFTPEEVGKTSDEWNAMREMMLAAEAVEKDSDHLDWWQILGWNSLDDWKTFHRHVADPTWAGIEDWKARH